MMDGLTHRKGELFKDEGQDAKKQKWGNSMSVRQTDIKGTGDVLGACALKQDLNLVVGKIEMVVGK